MSRSAKLTILDPTEIRLIKKLSGERIREARRRLHIKQGEFADHLRISDRWLREIENGNPGTKLDDHLYALVSLGLNTGAIGFSIVYIGHRMPVPKQLLHSDTTDLERQCIDLISRSAIKSLTDELTPEWWSSEGQAPAE